MLRDVYFYERQSFHPIGTAAALVTGMVGLLLLLPLPDAEVAVGPIRGIPGAACLLISVLLLNFLTMTTSVYPDEIVVHFGRLVPFYHRHIPVGEIDEARAIAYRPLRQAGGWGVRFGSFEGEKVQFLNAQGAEGVLLRGPGRSIVVGSAYPDRLCEAVERACSERGEA